MAVALLAGLVVGAGTGPAGAIQNGTVPANTPANRANARMTWVEGSRGSDCSATLVAPRIVLTAGHCMTHPEPNPPLHQPYWQTTTKVGTQDWEQPGRWYQLYGHPSGIKLRFGLDSSSPAATRTATEYSIATSTDAVLLRFATPIPASVATPVPILTRTPGNGLSFWNNRPLVLMGYNGTNKLTSGAFKTPTANATTCLEGLPNYLCSRTTGSAWMVPGDSGGPQFWTDTAGQRWLVASNGIGGNGDAWGPRTSHRGQETSNARFPDMQQFYDRQLGAADIAFTQVNASGVPYAGATQVAQGANVSVTHPAVGQYNVVLPKVLGNNTVHIAPHGTTKAFCQARAANPTSHVVECFTPAGARVDTGFSILSTSRWADARATVMLNGTTPQVTVGAAPGSTGLPTVSRAAVGRYRVVFPNMVGALGNVIVNPVQGSGRPTRCSVLSWGANTVEVACVQGNTAADASFAVLGIRKDLLETRSEMFAWANNPTAAQYSTPSSYSQQNGGAPVAQRSGVGQYRIHFAGAQNTFNGVWLVSSYGAANVHCGINPANYFADVRCTSSSGAPVDARYVVRHLKPLN